MELGVSHVQNLSSLPQIVDNIFDKYNKNMVPIRSLSDHDSMIISNFSHIYLTHPSLCFYKSGRMNQWEKSISTFKCSWTFELFNNIFLWEGLVVLKRTVLLSLWHCLRLFLDGSSVLTGYPSALWLHT